MREAWYHQVIEACALTSDLKVINSLESIAFPAVDISISTLLYPVSLWYLGVSKYQ